jgi:plasmid maintenance system killer protein
MRCTKLTLAFVILGVIAWVPCDAGEYTDQVRLQLGAIRAAAERKGWQETHAERYKSLREGEALTFGITLRANTAYKIIGACDNDCTDLDFYLYDENNNEISRDASADSMPIATVTPEWTGRFKLKVKMFACRSDPCFMGVSIVGR